MTRTVGCRKITENQTKKKKEKPPEMSYNAMDELAGGLGKGWTTCTTSRRRVSGRVAEKLLT